MSLDRMWQLDPTSGSNGSISNYAGASVAEGGPPSAINNALRALGSMITREIAFQASAISASVSTNLVTAANSGLLTPILGAGAINSFGVIPGEQPSAAVLRFVQFSSSASLSNGTALRLLGNASRRTQPGDIGGYLHAGSSDVWHEFLYSRADGALAADSVSVTTITNRSLSTSAISTVTLNAASASITAQAFTTLNATSISASVLSAGRFNFNGASNVQLYIQTVTVMSGASNSTSSNIPYDTSIPQNNEGGNAFSLSITPKNASSILEVEGLLFINGAATGTNQVAALFLDNAANAIAAASTEGLASDMTTLPIYFEHTASTTSLHVYALRYGGESGAAKLNHGSGGNLGGVMRSWLRVRERLS